MMIIFNNHIVSGQVGINTPTPDQNAILEMYTNNKGLLPPRVSLVNITSASPLSQHVKGIIVYNTVNNASVNEGLYVNNGTQWFRLSTEDMPFGHVKYSVLTSDHSGWYLLNGRTVSSLPIVAQTNAVSLGFAATIPDATNRYLKAKTGTEALGTTGGTLVQANLPAMTFYGTALSAGDHSHTITDRGNTAVNAGGLGNDNADDTAGIYTTSSAGNHSHSFTVNTGGTNTPVPIDPKHLNLNVFMYLGQ
ncbi:hypothetical protein DBR28_10080 [Chryseobacterium sp. HMWF028]|nr:hypothetical protein DBR28_10080 [Chryseobacterium sp. HMWF028]